MRRLLHAASGALLLLGCGGAPAPSLFVPDDLVAPQATLGETAAAVPPVALGVPLPSPALRALAPAATGPVAIADGDPRLYEFLVAIEGPRAFLLGAEARADYAPAWGDEDLPPAASCPTASCGAASLPVGAPPEAAYWLALADLYWRGPEDGAHRAMTRTAETRGEGAGESATASRQLIRFSPAAGVACAAQQKWFAAAAEPVAQAADPVVAAAQRQHAIVPAHLPAARADAGRGQLLLRQRGREDGRFVVELHVALDHGAVREAEVMDAVVVCESDAPIAPERIGGFAHRLARGDDGQWTMMVFPR